MQTVKIVRRDDNGRLISAVVEGKALVEYQPGEDAMAPKWLAEKGYHLTVFEALKDAVIFRKSTSMTMPVQFWWAEVPQAVRPDRPLSSILELKDGLFDVQTLPWPEGTLFAESVRLTKRVSWDEIAEAYQELFEEHVSEKS